MSENLYSCDCSCLNYTTNYDMDKDLAIKAAEMHIMLDGDHTVRVRHIGEAGFSVVDEYITNRGGYQECHNLN